MIHKFKNNPQKEQNLIKQFFAHKKVGFFVDLGANEPIIESQSYHLEQLGWNGLLIEPLPQYTKLLKEQITSKVIEYACSNPHNQGKSVNINLAGPHSTLNKKPIAINSTSNQTTTVTCKTLDSILQDNNVPIGFEFISIDIEGHEMEMFKGFSLKKWQPQLILLKDHLINHKKHSYMKINNSQLILRTGLNSWYIPQSQKYKFSMSSKLEIFRKYWLGLLTREIKYKK